MAYHLTADMYMFGDFDYQTGVRYIGVIGTRAKTVTGCFYVQMTI